MSDESLKGCVVDRRSFGPSDRMSDEGLKGCVVDRWSFGSSDEKQSEMMPILK